MKVVAVRKSNFEEEVLKDSLTYEEAESFCDEWGWSYTDENNISWWLEIRE